MAGGGREWWVELAGELPGNQNIKSHSNNLNPQITAQSPLFHLAPTRSGSLQCGSFWMKPPISTINCYIFLLVLGVSFLQLKHSVMVQFSFSAPRFTSSLLCAEYKISAQILPDCGWDVEISWQAIFQLCIKFSWMRGLFPGIRQVEGWCANLNWRHKHRTDDRMG